MASVGYAHIAVNQDGKPVIAGTRTKVVMIAVDHLAGWDANEIRRHYPYLTLGQIHSALAYYYDHKEEMDRSIEETDRLAEESRAAQGESPILRKLNERGQIP